MTILTTFIQYLIHAFPLFHLEVIYFTFFRHYAFRPASREAVECCRFQSQKISIYVTKSRMILLDCQVNFAFFLADCSDRHSNAFIFETYSIDQLP